MTAPAARVDLKAERLRRGMSQAEFARAAGVTEDVIRTAEDGGTPRPSNRLAIARLIEHDVMEIWPMSEAA